MSHVDVQGMLMVLLLGWLFLPIYIASRVRQQQNSVMHTHTQKSLMLTKAAFI